jgi:hypothetical protein
VGRSKGSARPGVKRNPLTKRELAILQMTADGFTPKELAGTGPVQRIWRVHERVRLKLDAFTTANMVAIAFRKGMLK